MCNQVAVLKLMFSDVRCVARALSSCYYIASDIHLHIIGQVVVK